MLDNRVSCPIEDCDYWVAFTGYLDNFIAGMRRHIRERHDLPMSEARSQGGLIDALFGRAIVEAFGTKANQ